jgi:hypothetical protein
MKVSILLIGALLLATTGNALAVDVIEKIDVKASPAMTWGAIGDFCGIKNWHPAIASCEITMAGDDQIRTLTTKDGAQFLEKLVAWSGNEADRTYTYSILMSPLAVTGYKSTLSVSGNGDLSVITWTGSFIPKTPDNGVEKTVSNIYQAGLKGLKAKLEGM